MPKRVKIDPEDAVEVERSVRRRRVNKSTNNNYVVTIIQEHFVNVSARDEKAAASKAIDALNQRWGDGRNPVVTEVERLP